MEHVLKNLSELLISLIALVFSLQAQPTEFPLGAPVISTDFQKIESIETREQDYFNKKGKYQYIKDGNFEVVEYETIDANKNKVYGYEIIEETPTQIIHTGYGPQAQQRTYVIQKPTFTSKSASTTP